MLTMGPRGRTWMRTTRSQLDGKSHRKLAILRNREAGQTLVLAALGLTVLMLAAGLSIDMGYLRYERRRIQAAADSAALAGAADSQYTYYQTSGQTDASYNGFTNSPGCNPSTAKCVSITVGPVQSGPFQGQPLYVQATVIDSNIPTFFMRIVGLNSETVSATAIARQGDGNGCFYGITSMGSAVYYPSGTDVGFDAYATACGVYSNSPMTLNSEEIDAGYVGCAQACTGPNIMPTAVTIVPVANPLAYLQPYTYSQTDSENCTSGHTPLEFVATSQTTPVPITPSSLSGYCGVLIDKGANVEFQNPSGVQTFTGQIQINENATVIFDPGTYVLGNGLSITADSTTTNLSVTGAGVTFYTAGTTGSINICVAPVAATAGCPNPVGTTAPVATVDLTAPTDPAALYPGVLFFQDPGNLTPGTVNGNNYPMATTGTTTLEGALYFPTAALNLLNLGSSTTLNLPANQPPPGYAAAVANQLYLGGIIQFGDNWPSGNSPIKNVVLVQ